MDRRGRGRAIASTTAPRRAARRAAVAATVLGSVLPVTACGVLESGPGPVAPTSMTITSGAFTQNKIPVRYTCGAGAQAVSPPLSWAGAPPGTKSLALVVDDADAPITPYVYWIVFDINPETTQMQEGQVPTGAKVARNSAGTAAYDPPCPGARSSHQYRFTVYALNTVLNLPPRTSLQSAWNAIAAATIGRGRDQPTAMSGKSSS